MKRVKQKVFFGLLLGGGVPLEGSSSVLELQHLMRTVQRTEGGSVAEIGFNAGYSSYAMLAAHPDVRVVSFDLGLHHVVRAGKRLIDRKFPGRHELIVGDSRETVPAFAEENPGVVFDVAFIDGGHDYEVAAADLKNMRALCSPDTVVVMDDLMPWKSWGEGPTRAWADAVAAGAVRQDGLFQDGRLVDAVSHSAKRAWAIGRYLLDDERPPYNRN
ncbi:hypothetical protein BST21_23435 [Mycolicibacterium celeriflavum]|nr:hypothetical protein BST21_23435 [Mycolicibacterium celeriflavum]